MTTQLPHLAESFLNYFDVSLVSCPLQQQQAEAIRYKVYCQELGYEQSDRFPQQREFDAYDANSMQLLISHRKTSRAAGCVRLILASEEQMLPMEDHCMENVYVRYLETLNEDRQRASEFSRLAVDPVFRKSPGKWQDNEMNLQHCPLSEQRAFGLIGIALSLSAFALANISGRTHLFAMMESTLPRLLRRSGIKVQKAGDPAEYHGQRSPFYITTEQALEHMREDLRILYDCIHQRLQADYRACADAA